MPEPLDIMRAIGRGLDEINPQLPPTNPPWYEAVVTKLYEIGRNEFGCKVGARPPHLAQYLPNQGRDNGKWLYDLTWLRYNNDSNEHLIAVPLIAQCYWDRPRLIGNFHKLLLARASVRLVIYSYYALMQGFIHGQEPDQRARREQAAQGVAKRLAESIRSFKYRHENEAWLLVGGVWHADKWCRYFTIDRNDDVVAFNP